MSGEEGDDTLIGGEGDDMLIGGDGTDVLQGGLGNDTIIADSTDTVDGGDGWDTLVLTDDEGVSINAHTKNVEQIIAGDGDDTLTANTTSSSYNLNFSGGDGDDRLQTGVGNDLLHGGKGNDTLEGGYGNDWYVFERGDGHDTISDITPYENRYDGGNDTLALSGDIALTDLVFMYRNGGLDIGIKAKDGTAITDVAGFDALADRVTVKDWSNTKRRIENLRLSDGTIINLVNWVNAYNLTAGSPVELATAMATAANAPATSGRVIKGLDDDEFLSAVEAGKQTVYGEGGKDFLYSGLDGDALHGGEGEDTVSYYHAKQGVSLNLSSGQASVKPDESENSAETTPSPDTLSGIENVEGGIYADDLTGDENANKLWGVGGDDVLDGGGGGDELHGGSGDDVLDGGGGGDELHGGSGDDVLDGGGGGDELHGGSGDDVYVIGADTGTDRVEEYYGKMDAIRVKEGVSPSQVSLVRDEDDLLVRIAGADNATLSEMRVVGHFGESVNKRIEKITFADDTEWDADHIRNQFALSGTVGDNTITGTSGRDIFDSDAGGDDRLHGYGGNDTYWLGQGTDHDTIREHHKNSGDAGDEIRIKSGIGVSDIRLNRSESSWNHSSYRNEYHLIIELLGAVDANGDRAVTDSLTVENYFTSDVSAQVEKLIFEEDGTEWGVSEFALVRHRGGAGNDVICGNVSADVFDADAGGDDRLHGYGGDDVYWLVGYGTDHDTIREHHKNSGDAGDVIKIKEGIGTDDIRLVRSWNGNDLHVLLLGEADDDGARAVTDRLIVEKYYIDNSAKIERLEFKDGPVWDANDFILARIRGGSGNDSLAGEAHLDDVFDSNAGGDDILRGLSGDDIYWLGSGRVTIPYKNTITIAAITATKLRYISVSGRIISVYHAVIMTI